MPVNLLSLRCFLLYTFGNSTVNRQFTDFKIFEVQKSELRADFPTSKGSGSAWGPLFLGPARLARALALRGSASCIKRYARAGRGSPGRVPPRLRARPRPILVSALASLSRGLACARPSPPSSPAPRAAPWAPLCRVPRAGPWPPCGGAWALSRGPRLRASGLWPLGGGPFSGSARPSRAVSGLGARRRGAGLRPRLRAWWLPLALRAGLAVGSSPPPPSAPRAARPRLCWPGAGGWRSRAALPRWAGLVQRPPHSMVSKGGR